MEQHGGDAHRIPVGGRVCDGLEELEGLGGMADPIQPATEVEERFAAGARPIASVESLVDPWHGDNGWGGEAAPKRP
jgi:hypothetical protein